MLADEIKARALDALKAGGDFRGSHGVHREGRIMREGQEAGPMGVFGSVDTKLKEEV